jgi:hypothetical protein
VRSLRGLLAPAALALLVFSFAPAFRPRESRSLLEISPDRGFAFDPGYRLFLEAVEKATPAGATVAVFAPSSSELYLYQAAYRLAPRRVVGKELSESAQFLAVYRRAANRPLPAQAMALPGGFLLKR